MGEVLKSSDQNNYKCLGNNQWSKIQVDELKCKQLPIKTSFDKNIKVTNTCENEKEFELYRRCRVTCKNHNTKYESFQDEIFKTNTYFHCLDGKWVSKISQDCKSVIYNGIFN